MLFNSFLVAVLLLDAALYAAIQPLLGKLLLPLFGGTPMVWNSTLMFFQMAFFLGAVYAHIKQKILSPRKQLLSHLTLLSLSLLMLPIAITLHEPSPSLPLLNLFLTLVCCAGLPIFIVACNSILLQTWCARSSLSLAKNPYSLFSVSHLGMMLGLCLYAAMESFVGLDRLTLSWSGVFIVFSVLMASTLWYLRKSLPDQKEAPLSQLTCARPSQQDRLWWVVYPMTTMALLLCFTQVISSDLASFPLLWIAPLVFYSLSFVVTFANQYFDWVKSDALSKVQLFFLICALLLLLFNEVAGSITTFVVHTGLFISSTLILHGRLAAKRPATAYLPIFYIHMGLGNLMGALLAAVLAPLLLSAPIEYNLVIIALCFLRAYWQRNDISSLKLWAFTLIPAIGVVTALNFMPTLAPKAQLIFIVSLVTMTAVYLSRHALQLSFLAAGLLLVPSADKDGESTLYKGRSFFGPSHVTQNGDFRYYANGNTLHGMQCVLGDQEKLPNSYYHAEGTFGHFMKVFQDMMPKSPLAIVGLGVGTAAAWGEENQKIDFIDIDTLVKKVAYQHFTYLKNSPAQINVLIGDGRAVLRQAKNESYGLIVMDAFSSDVIPTHLVTLEAVQNYVTKLLPNGALMIHATSRYYDLRPLLVALARRLGMTLLHGNDENVNGNRNHEMIYVSNWFVLTNNANLTKKLEKDELWNVIDINQENSEVLWTDNYANQAALLNIKTP